MKVETIAEIDSFKPIELKITIESEEELCNLWHRMNTAEGCVPFVGILKHGCTNDLLLWAALEKLVIKNNLYK